MTSKITLTTLALLFIASFSFGQKPSTDTDWTTLQTKEGVTVSYMKADCNLPADGSYTEEVYMKFTNSTDQLVYVDWTFDVTYGERCINCDGKNEEMNQTLKLAPNTSLQGECGDKNDFRLRIFSKFLDMENPESLKSFHVKILTVRKAE